MADAEGRTERGEITPDVKTSEPGAGAQGSVVRLVPPTTPLPTAEGLPSASTTHSQAASAVDVVLQAANAARRRLTVDHPDTATATLYVKYGGVALATDYTFRLLPGDTIDDTDVPPTAVHGIWSAADGSFAQITEYV